MTKSTPPADPPNPKILENGPFGENRGFQAWFEPQKGGGWGFTQGPPKKAIFGHFWPFLAIFDHFWPFLTIFDPQKMTPPQNPQSWPQNVSQRMWAKVANFGDFWPKKGEKPPQKPPWPDRLYLIIGLLGRKFGICAENEDFSAPRPRIPLRCRKCECFPPNVPVITKNIYINNKNIIKSYYNIFNYNKLIIF